MDDINKMSKEELIEEVLRLRNAEIKRLECEQAAENMFNSNNGLVEIECAFCGEKSKITKQRVKDVNFCPGERGCICHNNWQKQKWGKTNFQKF